MKTKCEIELNESLTIQWAVQNLDINRTMSYLQQVIQL